MSFPVAILWHMHQPHYGDPLRGVYTMPWVRLHAAKGYFDMTVLALGYEGLKVTFNLVPGLLEQIVDLGPGGTGRDLHGELSAKPATELTPEERRTIVATFFLSNWDTMVRPYPRYHELLQKRGTEGDVNFEAAAASFTAGEMRDLQTWGNLTWFGFEAVRRFPEVAALRRKGRDFTEGDKGRVLAIQREILGLLPGLWADGLRRGLMDLTTTPFYHPILPLLVDTDAARRAQPHVLLPARHAHPDSARWHLSRALELHGRLFGSRPRGLWPSEGSVSPEAAALVAEAGLAWLATDEGVRHRSKVAPADASIYQPFRLATPAGDLAIFFRDHALSDRVGFTYSKNKPAEAWEDFRAYALGVRDREGRRDGALLPVILDGENAWEHYADGGEGFLRRLYEALAGGKELRGTTFSDHLAAHPDRGARPVVRELHSGSWIDASFRIWIGHAEKNAAWEQLHRAHAFLDAHGAAAPPAAQEAARVELARAEGSDWFWWYGDDFSAATDEEFDTLFRHHVAGMYVALGQPVPEAVQKPLLIPSRPLDLEAPIELIRPTIDGEDTHYFEWHAATTYDVRRHSASMYSSERFVTKVALGFDERHLYLRLDPHSLSAGRNPTLLGFQAFVETDRGTHTLSFPFRHRGPFTPLLWRHGAPEAVPCGAGAAGRVLELAVPFGDLGVAPGESLCLFILLFEGSLELDRFPRRNRFTLRVPTSDFERRNWLI